MAAEEQFGSREETRSRRGMSALRRFICKWEDRYTDPGLPRLSEAYPDSTAMFCVEISYRPVGRTLTGDDIAAGHTGDYTYCMVDCRYSTVFGDEDNPAFAYDMGMQVLSVGGGRVYQGTPDYTLTDPVNLYIPTMEERVELTMFTMPSGAIYAALGCVNANTWRGYRAETVRFDGCQTRGEWDNDAAVWKYRLSYRFTILPQSWNLVWNPNTAEWDYTDPLLYQTSDFNGMYVPDI